VRIDRIHRCGLSAEAPRALGRVSAVAATVIVMDNGQAGASARREFEQRRRERDAAIAGAPPTLRDLLHTSGRGARDIAAWDRGSEGERIVGRALDDLAFADAGVRVLHDRRMPAAGGNIDHIAITASGVYVIDAKHYTGRPRVETRGSGATETRRFFVDRDDRTALVDGVRWQVMTVEEAGGLSGVPVNGVLCFIGADWSISNGFLIDGVGVTSPERLTSLLRSPGPLSAERVESVHRHLGAALRPA